MVINILILGEPSQLVRFLVNKALEKSYNVTILLSKPDALMISHPDLEILKGDVNSYADMKSAIGGQDAVLWAFENIGSSAINIGTQNMILGMQEMKVRRLICLSSIGSGSSALKMGTVFQLITYFRGNKLSLEAKAEQEKMISSSNLDFSIVQVGVLNNECADGIQIKVIQSNQIARTFFTRPVRVCRAIVANFMISQLKSDQWLQQTVCLFPDRSYFSKIK